LTFQRAVEQTPDLKGAWREGLKALREIDRNRVDAQDTRRIKGSVDVEEALVASYPGERQWDYAVGFHPTNLGGEVVVYRLEVHPAKDGEVRVVLEKLQFLKKWLRERGTKLNTMRRAFIWVSSGKTSFTLTAPQQKQFALHGLQHPGRYFNADFRGPENS
jgi:hypothetical protein